MNDRSPERLWNRNFFLLSQGQLVSSVGSQAFNVAVAFWVKHATGSASLLGTLMMLTFLPTALLGPVAGVAADRLPRRRIIILCDVVAGLAVLVLTAFLFLTPERTELLVALLFPGALLMGVVRAFFGPAMLAAIPDLVPRERLAAANSISQAGGQVAQVLGQGLGGALFVMLGAPLLFLANGLSYLFSALSEAFIEIPQKLAERRSDVRTQLREARGELIAGFRFVFSDAGLRTLLLTAATLNFLSAPVLVLLPFYVEDTLGASPAWYGYIVAAFSAGVIVGYGAAGLLKLSGGRRTAVVLTSILLSSTGTAVLGAVPSAALATLLMAVVGILDGLFSVYVLSLVQAAAPSEMRGRVFGFLTAMTSGLLPLGMGLGGVVADLLDQDIPRVYFGCGGLQVALAVGVAFHRDFRRFLASEPEGPSASML